jgi:hypothetical protein
VDHDGADRELGRVGLAVAIGAAITAFPFAAPAGPVAIVWIPGLVAAIAVMLAVGC